MTSRVKPRTRFDLRRCEPMSRDEEHCCALEYVKTRDPALARRLVIANMRLVVALARRYCRSDQDLGDIVQEGNWGLLRAVERYDPTRGIKFCSYAVWWIRASMLKFTMDNWRLVKVGTTLPQRKLFFGSRTEREHLERAGHFAGAEVSLDAPLKTTGAATVGDLLTDRVARGPDERVEDAEFLQLLQVKLKAFGATLRNRDAQIFRRRLLSEDPITMKQMAGKFGVSRERTRQVEERLKQRLRAYLQDEMGDAVGAPPIGAANVAMAPYKEAIVLQGC